MAPPVHNLDLEAGELEIEFADDDALDAYLDSIQEDDPKALLGSSLPIGTTLRILLTSPNYEVSLPSKVLEVFPSGTDAFGTVFEVLDWSDLEDEDAEDADAPDTDAAENDAGTPLGTDSTNEARGHSTYFDVHKLNPSERIRLASRAGRNERRVLLRESSAAVAMALLSNPQIEVKEVLQIVKNPQAATPVLQRVSADRRFSGNYEIQLALVRNPKTPSPVATRLVERLHTSDLSQLAKSQALRENIRRAALRVYLTRSN